MLKLSHISIGKLSIGNIVNLASNDVQRFDKVGIDTDNLVILFEWIY